MFEGDNQAKNMRIRDDLNGTNSASKMSGCDFSFRTNIIQVVFKKSVSTDLLFWGKQNKWGTHKPGNKLYIPRLSRQSETEYMFWT